MDALIIAAGYGSRLSTLSRSKPLTLIAGIPLIELGVRQAKAAGAERVVVVTGHEAQSVEDFLADLAVRADMTIEPVRLDDWSRPNGWSVMAGAAHIDGDYLLMMADHIFAAPILQRLAVSGGEGAGGGGRGVTLAIDRRIDHPLIDPDDATWVRTTQIGRADGPSGGRIIAIGKTIADYDAVDCGAFLATSELAEAIGQAIAAGRPGSLSDGMQYLADKERAFTLDISALGNDSWWIDVDDPKAHAIAEAEAPLHLAALYGVQDRYSLSQ